MPKSVVLGLPCCMQAYLFRALVMLFVNGMPLKGIQ